jgi:hypothetical protein
VIAAAILLAAAGLAFTAWRIADVLQSRRREAVVLHLIETFAPGAAAIQQDPKQLLAWYPLAQTSRRLFPDAFKELDRAAGGTFPFSKAQLQAAHARCSSDWLAWEHANEAEFALKTAQVQDEIDRAGQASPLLRTRLAAIEQQKLQRYQQRYEEYITTAKAIAAYADNA